jgi:hypothetical protein
MHSEDKEERFVRHCDLEHQMPLYLSLPQS